MFCSIGPADSVRPAARLSELGYMFRIGLKQGWGNTGTLLLVLTWKKPSKMVRGKEEEIMPGGRREGERKAVWRCLASCGQSGELQRDLLCGISTPCFFFFLSPLLFSQPQQTIPLTRTSRTDFCFSPPRLSNGDSVGPLYAGKTRFYFSTRSIIELIRSSSRWKSNRSVADSRAANAGWGAGLGWAGPGEEKEASWATAVTKIGSRQTGTSGS